MKSLEEIAERILPINEWGKCNTALAVDIIASCRTNLESALRNGTLYVKEELEDEYAKGFEDGHQSHMREYKKLEQELGEAKKAIERLKKYERKYKELCK